MNSPEPQWQAATNAISAADTILLVSHIAPDGDAVGSLLGLSHCLLSMGKGITSAIDGGAPPDLAFVPGSESILSAIDSGAFDLLICLDSSDIARIGEAGAYGLEHSRRVINLDHHPTNTRFGDIHLIAPEAVAAAEVVYDLIARLPGDINQDAATALLTGLVTDTRGFRISATKARTLEIAQDLMSRGANLSRVMAQTLNRRSFAEVMLWKAAFPSVQLDAGLIQATITRADLGSAGMSAMTDSGLVNHLVAVDQARVSVVFKELPSNEVEISFRAKPGYDVSALALSLGGGGHTLASGCTVSGSLAQARARVLPLAQQVIAEGNAALGRN